MDHSNSGMEYENRQHGDVSGVGSQLPMPLSKFQSNVSASRTSSAAADNNNISEKKKIFEGHKCIVGQHQLLQVKSSLPATATSTTGSSTASSSSMKKFFGRNKGYILTVCVCVCVCVCV